MRYRALSADFDYTFGQSQANFLINSPEAVAQAIRTRLLLLRGQWFLDVTEGLPLRTKIIGRNTYATYDAVIRQRIRLTQGVVSIDKYSSELDNTARGLTVHATVTTIYSAQQLALTVQL